MTAVLAWMVASRSQWTTLMYYGVLPSFAVAMLSLFWVGVRRLPVGATVMVAVLVSVLGLVIFDILAFTWFRGFAKDMTAFTTEHFARTAVLEGALLGTYLAMIGLAMVGRRLHH